MTKHLIRIASVGIVFTLVVVAGAFGKSLRVVAGNLVFVDSGRISPSKLPKHEQAPTAAILNGTIGTNDGTHPPALMSVVADFDRTIQVNAIGLPVCRQSQLTAQSTVTAKRACGDAIVGSGEGEVEVAFPEQAPFSAKGPILLFNGGVQGGTTLLLIHAYVAVPAPTAVIATVELTRVDRGRLGLHAVAQIPRIAGGAGSVTRYKVTIDRKYTYKGKQESYLTASCPTGNYYAEGTIRFSDDTSLKVTHALPCTPRD